MVHFPRYVISLHLRFITVFLFAFALLPSVQAQEILNEVNGEYARLEHKLDALWDQRPFVVRRALYVAAPPGGYGVFNPRNSATFSKKDHKEAIIYLEPMFYGYAREGELHAISINLDLALLDAEGKKTLAEVKGFGKFHLRSRHRNKEFFMHVTLNIESLPEGKYRLLLILSDQNKKATAKVALPLHVAP